MIKSLLIGGLFTIPPAVAALADAAIPLPQTVLWTDYATMLTPLVLFIMGLMAKPLLENTVNAKLSEVEARFVQMEKDAHGDIIKSIERSTSDFHSHNADQFAHPNLSAAERTSEKLSELAREIALLRGEVGAMKARVARTPKRK